MQLLKITTTPIEYELQIDNASLKVTQNKRAQMNMKKSPSELKIRTDNIEVRINTRKARESLGFKSASDLIYDARDKGIEAAKNATAQYAEIGNQMAQIQTGQNISTILAQQLYKQPNTTTVFLPLEGADISWKPASIDTDFKPATINSQWQDAKFNMEYVPSKYHMSILQYPKVTIEYLGDPNYVPPSANPSYQAEE